MQVKDISAHRVIAGRDHTVAVTVQRYLNSCNVLFDALVGSAGDNCELPCEPLGRAHQGIWPHFRLVAESWRSETVRSDWCYCVSHGAGGIHVLVDYV